MLVIILFVTVTFAFCIYLSPNVTTAQPEDPVGNPMETITKWHLVAITLLEMLLFLILGAVCILIYRKKLGKITPIYFFLFERTSFLINKNTGNENVIGFLFDILS